LGLEMITTEAGTTAPRPRPSSRCGWRRHRWGGRATPGPARVSERARRRGHRQRRRRHDRRGGGRRWGEAVAEPDAAPRNVVAERGVPATSSPAAPSTTAAEARNAGS